MGSRYRLAAATLLLLAGCLSARSLLEHRGEGVTRFYEASFAEIWKAARTAIEANGLRLEEASEYHRYILAVHPPDRGPGAPEDAVALQSDQGERIGVFVDSAGPGRWAVEVVTRRRFPLDPNRLSWAEDIFWVIERELGADARLEDPDTLPPGPGRAGGARAPPPPTRWAGRRFRPLAEETPKTYPHPAMGTSLPLHGRGAAGNPPNRFQPLTLEREEWTRPQDPDPSTRFYRDRTRSLITTNESPDVGFEASINPYRGCEHGCIYCYARPGHEYLGLSAGLDFETKIFVKEDAPELLRRELSDPGWEPKVLAMSGVTDPYQPVERRLEVTRGCLEVLAECRNPVSIVTKSRLVTRDADLLGELARHDAVRVTLSVTTLDEELRRVMEPRAPTPEARLGAIRKLAGAGIPVGVLVAPVVPGLTEHEIPSILEAVAGAGASHASYVLLRLPHAVSDLFGDWLERHFPDRKEKVLGRIREMRDGELNDPRFGSRMRGEGPLADGVRQMFEVARRRHDLGGERAPLSTDAFRRPAPDGQLDFFRQVV